MITKKEKLKYERPFIKKLNAGVLNKFGRGSGTAAVKDIEGIPVADLIEGYGSPLFALSERQIRRNLRAAQRAFQTSYPKVQFAWSYKTNYLNAVCNIFHQEGSWAEVVSGFEYRKALGNGVAGHQIIFNGPGKKRADLLLAIENNSLIHIDNFDELYLLINLYSDTGKKPRVAIRVNMDTGHYPLWDRFGFNYENGEAWSAINKVISSGAMQLVGLHCHIGTFVTSTAAYGKAAFKMCDLALNCRNQLNNPIEYLDMGGGFPSANTLKGAYFSGPDHIPSLDDYASAISNVILSAGFKQDELPLLILETGRALIDDAGYLLGSVVANKRLGDGKRAVILDFGVNTLFTSFWYDHQVSPAVKGSTHTEATALYGPLCMNIDMIRDNVSMPLLNPGDPVVVHKVGAYNMTQWMQFITLRPGIVLIDENRKVHQLRLPETQEYVEEFEQVPEHLKLYKLTS
jgi:diaminopimelate decarboxylase